MEEILKLEQKHPNQKTKNALHKSEILLIENCKFHRQCVNFTKKSSTPLNMLFFKLKGI